MTKRAVRKRSPRPVVPTTRDLDLLTLVGLCRYASVEQLERELFPSADRARRRVRQLFDAGLISVTVTSSTAPALVSLTRQGLALLAAERPAIAERARPAGPIRLAGVRHHLAVVDARIATVLWAEAADDPVTEWANAGDTLGDELGFAGVGLAPDGLAVVESGAILAVEVDLGTEGKRVLGRKLARYTEARTAEVGFELWLVYAGGTRRKTTLAELVRDASLGDATRLIPHEATTVRPLAPVPGVVGRGGGRADAVGLKTAAPSARDHERRREVASACPTDDGWAAGGVDGRGRR